jgi:hypothetical protein
MDTRCVFFEVGTEFLRLTTRTFMRGHFACLVTLRAVGKRLGTNSKPQTFFSFNSATNNK